MSANPTSFRLPSAYNIPEFIEHKGEKIKLPPEIRQNIRMNFNATLDAHQAIVKLKQQLASVKGGTTVNNVTNNTTVQGATNPSFTTSGQGYFFSAGIFLPIASISRGVGSSWATAINRVNVVQFTIPYGVSFQVSQLSINVTAGSIGDFGGFGIYSADGNTKIVDSGPMSLNGTGALTSTIPAVVLVGGTVYNWAQTATTTTASMNTTSSLSTNDAILMNANAAAPRIAVAANASVGGQLPATLGALTAVSIATAFDMALVMLEP